MIEKIFARLKHSFYLTTSLLIIFFVSVVFRWIDFSIHPQPITTTSERYLLLLTLLSIPIALWVFKKMIQKNQQLENEKLSILLYQKAYFVRLFILCFVSVLNILAYGLSLKTNFMLCALMVFVALAFCKPSKVALEYTINPTQITEK